MKKILRREFSPRKITLFLVVLFMVNSYLFASRYTGDFMRIGVGVRSLGMSGAFTALADDGSAIFWNSAGMAQMDRAEIGFMRSYMFGELATYDFASYCQPLPGNVTIGVSWTRLAIEDIPIYNEPLDPTEYLDAVPDGYFNSTDDLLQFAFAKRFHYDLSMGWNFYAVPFEFDFGGSVKYIKRSLYEFMGNGAGFDLSFLAKTDLGILTEISDLGDLKFGVNFRDVGGTNIVWDTESKREDKAIFSSKLGIALDQPIQTLNLNLKLAFDIEYLFDVSRAYGAEIYYKDRFGIRGGYNEEDYSAGVSVNLYSFYVDYAFITNDLGNTNRIGLRARF